VKGGSFQDTATEGYSSQDIRFTAKGATLYAIALKWPENRKLTIRSLAKGSPHGETDVKEVQLLGSKEKLKWTRDAGGLNLELPARKTGEYAFVFKISGLR
jgi:alpha-L-fucosidase